MDTIDSLLSKNIDGCRIRTSILLCYAVRSTGKRKEEGIEVHGHRLQRNALGSSCQLILEGGGGRWETELTLSKMYSTLHA
jgi:hypothetical protein